MNTAWIVAIGAVLFAVIRTLIEHGYKMASLNKQISSDGAKVIQLEARTEKEVQKVEAEPYPPKDIHAIANYLNRNPGS